MPQFKFEPKKELEYISERMKKFVEELPESFAFEFARGFSPRVDVLHDESTVQVFAELPAISKENIAVKVRGNVLHISGTKPLPEAYEQLKPLDVTRMFGEFSRDVHLPAEVDRENIQAKFSEGVLQVTLRKIQPDTSDEVAVEIE